MNIVYFGTDVFLPCFDYLTRRHNVLALYTYHNDEDYFTEYAIVRKARALGIPVRYGSITEGEITRYVTEEGCGLFFIAEYNRIIPIPPELEGFRGINTHSSLLPQGRSYYPIEGAMERGLAATGVTMHKLTARLDGGEILAQRRVELAGLDSVDVYLRCAACAREMLEEILADLEGAWSRGVPQTEKLPYWRRPAEELLTLDHRMTAAGAEEIFRRYNTLTQVELEGGLYYVTALVTGRAPLPEERCRLAEDRWLYAVSDGHLRLSVRPAPRKEDTP